MYNFDKTMNRKDLNAIKFVPQIKEQEGALPFWIADMDFVCSDGIKEGLIKRTQEANYGYTKPRKEYFTSIVNWMEKRHNWQIEPEWIVPNPGIVAAMGFVFKVFAEPGDKVLIQTPVYHMFSHMIEVSGGIVINSELRLTDGRYQIDFDDFEKKASDPKVKLFYLCNPHNPTSNVWTVEELKKLGEICVKHDVLIFSDDIHHDLIMPTYQYTPITKVDTRFKDISIIATAPNKTFNIAGFKTGNIIIENEELRSAYQKYTNQQRWQGLSISSIEANIAAYGNSDEWYEEMLAYVIENNRFFDTYVKENIPLLQTYTHEATYLKWIDFTKLGFSDKELNQFLLNEARVWLNAGQSFGEGGRGFMRFNIATSREMIHAGLQRIKNAVDAI
ncbi:hypothetical protein RV11_GL000280 [Enterococcus phoeniculicola]|uniref:cysteine-S-conjugate beta-lyase n=1 Tax=Enterococcus phoeniculicola ATCC BAA-412 TaxID=1158610 RepID=R3TR66_9ENTE|nr:MalY/PatB family protein [Enterococcus phoeniculicola]EOL44024.1 hypothetical protein UC3_01654 [Enterococcus phoeniculicola ATCC BAA-412]EOT75126.1 hypothetical protein I589_02726 [Enterococcus phoeniculicola ATCC BAA-412]OJG71574.1 hypothetical protein RV11_GL000280 [Enterococcus phoeniculicola]